MRGLVNYLAELLARIPERDGEGDGLNYLAHVLGQLQQIGRNPNFRVDKTKAQEHPGSEGNLSFDRAAGPGVRDLEKMHRFEREISGIAAHERAQTKLAGADVSQSRAGFELPALEIPQALQRVGSGAIGDRHNKRRHLVDVTTTAKRGAVGPDESYLSEQVKKLEGTGPGGPAMRTAQNMLEGGTAAGLYLSDVSRRAREASRYRGLASAGQAAGSRSWLGLEAAVQEGGRADAQSVDQAFQRDARRYDGKFTLY